MPETNATAAAAAEARNTGDLYATALKTHEHAFVADEPLVYGGQDTGPSPADYLCAALASCTVITLRMYAQRKGWKVDTINARVTMVKGTEMPSGNNTFCCEVAVTGELDDQQKKRLQEIANACPVHRWLIKPSDVITTVAP